MALPTEQEIERLDHYFAVQCNNDAWDLADAAERTDERTREMLNCAAASAWHWSRVGKPINTTRADMLLGWVNALASRPSDARAHTDAVRSGLADNPEGISDWDHAFLALLEARTRLSESDRAGFTAAYEQLDAARAKLKNEKEQEVFDRFRAGMDQQS